METKAYWETLLSFLNWETQNNSVDEFNQPLIGYNNRMKIEPKLVKELPFKFDLS